MQGLGQMSNTHRDMYSIGYKVNVNSNVKPTLFEQPFKHMLITNTLQSKETTV
jgi:hypothetical protein